MSFKTVTAENGVKYIASSLIGTRHGFATRIGGVSREEHTSSLNLAFGRGDSEETVLENLRLFADAVGVDVRSVISHPQIHSTIVEYVTCENCGEGYFVSTDAGCDGYVTDRGGITLGVKTADCVPILFHDPVAGIIGAVHAGWRGAASGIAAECVSKMRALGADVKNIRTAIGPSIHFCCYEVGEDFRQSVAGLIGDAEADKFISQHNGRLHADIVGINRMYLLGAGISEDNVDVCEMCTCCEPEMFFSHRYSKGKRGTMLSVIAL